MIPVLYQFVLLALIAYRVWHLLAEDDVLKRPRHWLVRLPRGWKEGDTLPRAYRQRLALFINCPYCLGFYVSLGVYLAWISTLGTWPGSVTDILIGVGIWFAISASVGLIRSTLDPPDE